MRWVLFVVYLLGHMDRNLIHLEEIVPLIQVNPTGEPIQATRPICQGDGTAVLSRMNYLTEFMKFLLVDLQCLCIVMSDILGAVT